MDKNVKKAEKIGKRFTRLAKKGPEAAANFYGREFKKLSIPSADRRKTGEKLKTPPMNELFKGMKD